MNGVTTSPLSLTLSQWNWNFCEDAEY